jgi:hypothetical protein
LEGGVGEGGGNVRQGQELALPVERTAGVLEVGQVPRAPRVGAGEIPAEWRKLRKGGGASKRKGEDEGMRMEGEAQAQKALERRTWRRGGGRGTLKGLERGGEIKHCR